MSNTATVCRQWSVVLTVLPMCIPFLLRLPVFGMIHCDQSYEHNVICSDLTHNGIAWEQTLCASYNSSGNVHVRLDPFDT